MSSRWPQSVSRRLHWDRDLAMPRLARDETAALASIIAGLALLALGRWLRLIDDARADI